MNRAAIVDPNEAQRFYDPLQPLRPGYDLELDRSPNEESSFTTRPSREGNGTWTWDSYHRSVPGWGGRLPCPLDGS